MYGIDTLDGQRTYEMWLIRQPARDLREMLADPEIDADSASFIRNQLSPQD